MRVIRPVLFAALLSLALGSGVSAQKRPARALRRRQSNSRRSSTARSDRPPAAVSRAPRACLGDPTTYYAATASGGVWKIIRRRRHVEARLRRSADLVDRVDRGRAVEPERRLRRFRRGQHPRQRRRRQRHLQVRPTRARPGRTSGPRTGQIGTMVVHPTNPDIAFAAVLGHAFGPNTERGVYRTLDGGKSWQQVLDEGRRHRRVRRRHRPVESRNPLRRLLAGAAAAVGPDQRRPGKRPLRLARRRRRPGRRSPATGCPTASGARSASRSRRRTGAASTR